MIIRSMEMSMVRISLKISAALKPSDALAAAALARRSKLMLWSRPCAAC